MTGLTLSAFRTQSLLSPVPRTVRLAVRRPRSGTMHGELWRGAQRHLAFDARQHGTNQSPMHVALVSRGQRGPDLAGTDRQRAGLVVRNRRVGIGIRSDFAGRFDQFRRLRSDRGAGRRLGRQHGRALLPPRRHFRLAIVVFGVAGGAAGLANLVFNHRDHGVITHTPFTRTIVIDDVTNPWLALLHEKSPGYAFQRWE
jgi:hypothetical protein